MLQKKTIIKKRSWLAQRYVDLLGPITILLTKIRVSPNFLSVLGFLLSLLAALFFIGGSLLWAAIILLIAGNLDILDGEVARRLNKNPGRFGAFLDSLADRMGELIIFIAIFLRYFDLHSYFLSILILWALAAALLVSYSRARAEGLGVGCQVGIMKREIRIILLITGSLLAHFLGNYFLFIAITIIAVLASFTVLQRIIHVYERTD